MILTLKLENEDGKEIERRIAIHADYDFSKIGEITEDMADTFATVSKEEKQQKEGEARSDEERGN